MLFQSQPVISSIHPNCSLVIYFPNSLKIGEVTAPDPGLPNQTTHCIPIDQGLPEKSFFTILLYQGDI